MSRQGYSYEVLVVDNASTDRTKDITLEFIKQHAEFSYMHEPMRGKGAAVRAGMMAGRGQYILFCDADMAVPIDELAKFLPQLQNGADIAIASREVEGAVRYNEPLYRHLMGRVFNLIVRVLVLSGIRDSQCGFKCFRHCVARELFAMTTLTGWSFDVEILCVARRRGYAIVEIPVHWYYGHASKVNPIHDSVRMLLEVLSIRRKLSRGSYD